MGFHDETYTVMGGIGEFAKLALGGAVTGFGAFLFLHTWLRWSAKHWLESTLVVLLVVYGCFFVCEVMFGVSGILSVVVIGLGMGRIGKYSIAPEAAHSLEAVMHAIGAIAEAAIFFFSGIVASVAFKNLKVFSSSNWAGGGDIRKHIMILLILFITIHLVRGITILIGLPILRSNTGLFGKGREGTSYGLRDKELIVILMSGLRGAVGLALASILVQEHSTSHTAGTDTEEVLQELFFYVAGVAVLTLLFNGTMISPFYEWLNVYPELRQKLIDREPSIRAIVKGLDQDMDQQWAKKSRLDPLLKEMSMSDQDMAEIRYMVPNFERFIVTPAGHLKVAKHVDTLEHIRGLLPKTVVRFQDQHKGYEADGPTSFSLDGWKDMATESQRLAEEYIYLTSTHRVDTQAAQKEQANSLRSSDPPSPTSSSTLSSPIKSKSKSFSMALGGGSSKAAATSSPSSPVKKPSGVFENKQGDEEMKDNDKSNGDNKALMDASDRIEKYGVATSGRSASGVRRASTKALTPLTAATPSLQHSTSLKMARLDQTYVTLVFTAIERLYQRQYETHELNENALVGLDVSRHEAVMLYEQKLVTLQAMSDTGYNNALGKEGDNLTQNGAPVRSRLSMMLVDMHAKQADAILERCLITELESMVALLPDPLALHRIILQLGPVGRFLYAAFPPLRWFLSYMCFGRVFACVEILVGYIRAHEDLSGFIAHLDHEEGDGMIDQALFQRISNIEQAVSFVAKEKLNLLAEAFPEAVHLTKLNLCALSYANMKLDAIHAIQDRGILSEHDVGLLKKPVAKALDDLFHCQDTFKMSLLVNHSLSRHIFYDESCYAHCFQSKIDQRMSSYDGGGGGDTGGGNDNDDWETELTSTKKRSSSKSSSSTTFDTSLPLGSSV